jgi:hypothetical protein
MRKDAACLAALCAALWFAPPAHAGTYDVVSCQASGGGGINRAWTVEPYNSTGAAPPALASFSIPGTLDSCPAVATLTVQTDPGATKSVKNGDGLAFVFRAPAGNTVKSVAIDRFMAARSSSASAQNPSWLAVARAGTTVGDRTIIGTTAGPDYCNGSAPAAGTYCTQGTNGALSPSTESIANATVVQWGFECQTATTNCVTGNGTASNAFMQLQGATVTVEDDTPPVVSAGSPLDGWHRPQDALVATGADGGGLQDMAVSIDGNPVAFASYTCDFHLPAPCANAPQLAVPLAGLADGPHNLTVTGVDVADNGSRGDRVVDVDGTAPALDLVPTKGRRTITFAVHDALSGVRSGQIAIRAKQTAPFTPLPTTLRGGRLRATVPKGKQPSDFGIEVSATDNAGNAMSGQATTMSLNTRLGKHLRKVRGGTATVPYRHRVVVTGRLTTVDGVPLASLPVLATTTLRQSHATPQPFRTVLTSRTGRFSFSVPPGPSRRVDVSFGGGADLLHRTRSVDRRVAAGATIRASRTTLFGAATVRFSGRLGLFGARLPAGGKIVVLEAEQHGHWATVASTRARGRHGAWRADAHFRGNPGTFPVRLRIPREAVFPYDTGHSRAIPIRVR